MPDFSRRLEAEFFQPREKFGLGLRKCCAPDFGDSVNHNVKRTRGDDFRIELLERTGGGVARIAVKFLARRLAFGVKFFKAGNRHEHFAAHLEHLRGGHLQWHAADGFQICGDVVAFGSVAARCAGDEHAVFVAQTYRDAVHFRLDNPGQFFAGQKFFKTFDEIADFFFGVSVVEAQHRHGMPDGFEFAQRLAADALARRIGRGEFGKSFFEIEQFVMEPVVIAVGNYRLRLDVVSKIVRANFFSELRVAFLGGGWHHHWNCAWMTRWKNSFLCGYGGNCYAERQISLPKTVGRSCSFVQGASR
jgi:hypothetical protein